ncbi:MAG: hypothetical protein E6Q76_05735 [Rhizobium sp.]|nr:MAG: hypothetical protein E6Q76_05735 [Rhizobium sp.]
MTSTSKTLDSAYSPNTRSGKKRGTGVSWQVIAYFHVVLALNLLNICTILWVVRSGIEQAMPMPWAAAASIGVYSALIIKTSRRLRELLNEAEKIAAAQGLENPSPTTS